MAIVFGFNGCAIVTPPVITFIIIRLVFVFIILARVLRRCSRVLFDEVFARLTFYSILFISSLFNAHINHKMSIQEYIETHNLSKRVEETINAAVKAKAPEPISFMVCKIVVSRLVVSSCFPSA